MVYIPVPRDPRRLITALATRCRTLVRENEQLKTDCALLKRDLDRAVRELGVLKTDIDNFKIWTKKLDWSTTEQPSWLNKFFDIRIKTGHKIELPDGTELESSGQLVDNRWHGLSQTWNLADGTVYRENLVEGRIHGVRKVTGRGEEGQHEMTELFWMGKNLNWCSGVLEDCSSAYLCADSDERGVSVGVLTRSDQKGRGYPIKNGYRIELHQHNDEIYVEASEKGLIQTAKWYQLKK